MASDNMKAAAQLYAQGMSMPDIARELDVSPATVRSWKSRGAFDGVAAQQHKRRVATERCNTQMMQSVEANDDLTEQQKLFCLFYAQSLNGAGAYRRAYPGANNHTATKGAYVLLRKPQIREEIKRLKRIRTEAMLVDGSDIVERMMRIAFADMSDFVEWSCVDAPVMGAFGPLTDKETGRVLTQQRNELRFIPSDQVDGTLIAEIRQGRDGASVKLTDRIRALEWLANYFELNPADRHKREFDRRRLALELLKARGSLADSEEPPQDDGFIAALEAKAGVLFSGGDDSCESWGNDDELE